MLGRFPRPPQGPEIRTGFLENEQPVLLEQGQEVTITTDYAAKGNKELIAMRWARGWAHLVSTLHFIATRQSPPAHSLFFRVLVTPPRGTKRSPP